MTDHNPAARPADSNLKGKLVLQMVIGGIAGALAMSGAMMAFDGGALGKPSGEQAFAVGVGVVYALMGLFVLFGAIVPTLGAKLLNVADSEELRDDKAYLVWSAATCIAFGIALIVAVVADPAVAILAPATGLAVFAAAMVLSVVACARMRRGQDEFRRLIGAESSQAGMVLVMLLFGGWAVAAHLGYAAMFTPLTFVAGLLAIVLVGAFTIVFRRGLIVR